MTQIRPLNPLIPPRHRDRLSNWRLARPIAERLKSAREARRVETIVCEVDGDHVGVVRGEGHALDTGAVVAGEVVDVVAAVGEGGLVEGKKEGKGEGSGGGEGERGRGYQRSLVAEAVSEKMPMAGAARVVLVRKGRRRARREVEGCMVVIFGRFGLGILT